MVKIDMEYAPFIYIGGERKINIPYTIDVNGRSINTAIGGIIDRVDIKDDTINIIDYKTGRSDNDTKTSLENIFANEISSAGYRLQAFLYSIILDELLKGKSTIGIGDFEWINKIKSNTARKISPSLIYINAPANTSRENFVVDVMKQPVTDITTIKEEYLEKMQSVLQEIFDADTPFVPAKDEKKCEFCDYREICGK